MSADQALSVISQVGFPIYVAVLCLRHQKKMHKANQKLMRQMATDIARLRKAIKE